MTKLNSANYRSLHLAAALGALLLSPAVHAQDAAAPAAAPPTVMMIVGVNGTGKTTTVGKLANYMKASGRSPLICAADTFRAAAVEQLGVWADRAGVDFIRAHMGSDPAAVAHRD